MSEALYYLKLTIAASIILISSIPVTLLCKSLNMSDILSAIIGALTTVIIWPLIIYFGIRIYNRRSDKDVLR